MANINMYAVIIEWDGQVPPTLYYQRMHKLELFVQARNAEERKMSPLKRRAIEDGSVVAQEGAVLCTSPSLARAVAQYAHELGAKVVLHGRVQLDEYNVTPGDQEIMDKLESVFGRRGRPSKEAGDFVVTCMEECRSYQVSDMRDITHCPYCSGLHVRDRSGIVDYLKVPDTGDVIDDWMRHRFAHGSFEVPLSIAPDDATLDEPPLTVSITHKGDAAAVGLIKGSPNFLKAIKEMQQATAFRVLDAVCASRSELEEHERKVPRVEAVVALMERKYDPAKIRMLEKPNEVDLLDAAAVLGPQLTASLFLTSNK